MKRRIALAMVGLAIAGGVMAERNPLVREETKGFTKKGYRAGILRCGIATDSTTKHRKIGGNGKEPKHLGM